LRFACAIHAFGAERSTAFAAGVPTQRAVQIVHAEVASRVRTMIINACAARRAGNTPEEMNQLLRWVLGFRTLSWVPSWGTNRTLSKPC